MTPADLVELELIKRLKYKYMRCLDQKKWDEMADCFTDDAVAEYSGGKYTYEGRDAILGFFRAARRNPALRRDGSHHCRRHHPSREAAHRERTRGGTPDEDPMAGPTAGQTASRRCNCSRGHAE